MIDKQFFEDLSQQISRLLPQAGAVGEDVRKAVNSALQKGFERLDLVTREDFDGQRRALARAEERIAYLETEMSRLEQMIDGLDERDSAASN
jgi:BMFP domain-containing protein YqiC